MTIWDWLCENEQILPPPPTPFFLATILHRGPIRVARAEGVAHNVAAARPALVTPVTVLIRLQRNCVSLPSVRRCLDSCNSRLHYKSSDSAALQFQNYFQLALATFWERNSWTRNGALTTAYLCVVQHPMPLNKD